MYVGDSGAYLQHVIVKNKFAIKYLKLISLFLPVDIINV